MRSLSLTILQMRVSVVQRETRPILTVRRRAQVVRSIGWDGVVAGVGRGRKGIEKLRYIVVHVGIDVEMTVSVRGIVGGHDEKETMGAMGWGCMMVSAGQVKVTARTRPPGRNRVEWIGSPPSNHLQSS